MLQKFYKELIYHHTVIRLEMTSGWKIILFHSNRTSKTGDMFKNWKKSENHLGHFSCFQVIIVMNNDWCWMNGFGLRPHCCDDFLVFQMLSTSINLISSNLSKFFKNNFNVVQLCYAWVSFTCHDSTPLKFHSALMATEIACKTYKSGPKWVSDIFKHLAISSLPELGFART